MGQIKNIDKYPFALEISPNDYVVGSVDSLNGQTRNFKLSDLLNFFFQGINTQTDRTYYHVQDTASTTWTITHNMKKYPTPAIFDEDGEVILTDFVNTSIDTTVITFGRPTKGAATLN